VDYKVELHITMMVVVLTALLVMSLGLMHSVRNQQHRLLLAVGTRSRLKQLLRVDTLAGQVQQQQQQQAVARLTGLLLVQVVVRLGPAAAARCWLVLSCRTASRQSS
jgi:hypothetical protein